MVGDSGRGSPCGADMSLRGAKRRSNLGHASARTAVRLRDPGCCVAALLAMTYWERNDSGGLTPDDRSGAAFGEQFEQAGVRRAAVQDDRALHTQLHRIQAVLDLGNHAAA